MTAARHLLWRYGPEWQTVVRVIETIRAADPPSLEAFATAARDAVWDAARAAARDAAWDAAEDAARGLTRAAEQASADAATAAARDAARGAAWDAATTAAWVAARGAAWDAAWAAAVFDLVGRHGYTRADHDALTAPYRAAFGDPWAGR